jgi:hypothetical protein
MSTDDVSKLPAWPKYPTTAVTGPEWHEHQLMLRDAYRERMEALADVVWLWRKYMKDRVTEEELAEIDALLAACEREEGR